MFWSRKKKSLFLPVYGNVYSVVGQLDVFFSQLISSNFFILFPQSQSDNDEVETFKKIDMTVQRFIIQIFAACLTKIPAPSLRPFLQL